MYTVDCYRDILHFLSRYMVGCHGYIITGLPCCDYILPGSSRCNYILMSFEEYGAFLRHYILTGFCCKCQIAMTKFSMGFVVYVRLLWLHYHWVLLEMSDCYDYILNGFCCICQIVMSTFSLGFVVYQIMSAFLRVLLYITGYDYILSG